MKARTFLAAAILLVSVSLSAQETETKETIAYSNITEFGLITASPKGVGLEATTAHGISFNKTHHLGLGVGIGMSWHEYSNTAYMPIFVNYRCYFKPNNSFSPHVNIAVGGLVPREGYGIYSSITMGFRAGKFSFSSGLSFTPIFDDSDRHYIFSDPYWRPKAEWYYPFGITLKWGFTF